MSEDTSDPGEGVAYPTTDERHRVEFALAEEAPSAVVVTAIAAISGQKPDELDPLYTAVDPDALDSLFAPTASGGHRADVEVTFRYHGYEVAVRSYGVIEIVALDGKAKPGSID